MRIAFVKTLTSIIKKDAQVILLTGDLGFSVFEPLIKKFPQQFVNVGVAEQNLTGVAAGLALSGKKPIIYSIVPFVTMRNLEQLRNDICYQNLNVKIVGVGAGFSYGTYAHTHYSLEDIGVLRSLANMTIVCPGDPTEVRLATKAMMRYPGPVYLRLGKAGDKSVHKKNIKFKLGQGIILKSSSKVTMIATSTLLYLAKEVVETFERQNIDIGLVSMHTLKPVDRGLIQKLCSRNTWLLTLEEHNVIGGLGSAVAEVMAEMGTGARLKRFGVPDRYYKRTGRQNYMRMQSGLSTQAIIDYIKKLFDE